MALLGKSLWKFEHDTYWCGASVIRFNYGVSFGNLLERRRGRYSFLWSGFLSCRSALKNCITHTIQNGSSTSFWKDRWFDRQAPMNLWPEFFVESPWPDGSVKDLSSLLVELPYNRELEASDYLQKITTTVVGSCDKFGWPFSLNGVFSVKSYIFLNDGGICCPMARFFWCKPCPQEIQFVQLVGVEKQDSHYRKFSHKKMQQTPYYHLCFIVHL